MVDFIIEVKQDGLDDNGLVKWTFSIIFIKGEGDVDIPFMYTSSEYIRKQKSFEERMVELREYRSEHGDCKVPAKFQANPSLGNWCHNIRQSYRMKQEGKKTKNKLTEENINELNGLGFEWRCRTETSIEDDKKTNSIKVQVRVQNDIFSHEDDGRALSVILPKRKKVNTKPIKIDNGCLKF